MAYRIAPCDCGREPVIEEVGTIERQMDGETVEEYPVYAVGCLACEKHTMPKRTRERAIEAWNDGSVMTND